MAGTVLIREVARATGGAPVQSLAFEPGVNVLVGDRNTGKTKWLETIDYLMGDDVGADQRGSDDIFIRYDSAHLQMTLAGADIAVERRWREEGAISKVYVDGEILNVKEYRAFLLERLGIPPIHYPQGNPYGPRTWPELGWRSLFRHMYRRQRFWSDLADQQPESEQFACLLQFLGVAEKLFSHDYGTLVEKEKRIVALQTQRDQFVSTLQEISRELIDAKELGVALTPDSIESAMRRLHEESIRLQRERARILSSLQGSVAESQGGPRDAVAQLGEEFVRLEGESESVLSAIAKAEKRLTEAKELGALIIDELHRMERAESAGSVLADLRVTHCPACDQAIEPMQDGGVCYLCKQERNKVGAPDRRLEFEVEQLRAELSEVDEMIKELSDEVQQLSRRRSQIKEERSRLEETLRPVRVAAATILPPELTVCDMQMGRIQEQLRQLDRIRASFGRREALTEDIRRIQDEVTKLEGTVSDETNQIEFESLGDILADGMNTYLNRMAQAKPGAWTQKEISVLLSDRSFRIKVGQGSWTTKLGGTLTLYFLLSYHYALMDLVKHAGCNYPGFALIDLPAEMLDGSSVADKENFIMVPFIGLLSEKGMEHTQTIAAGSAFEGLEGAHRVELHEIWK